MENFPVSQEVLRTDLSGRPLEWINYRDVVRLDYLGQIAYSCGSNIFKVYGGHNAITGNRSVIKVNSIIATFICIIISRIRCRFKTFCKKTN